MLKKRLLTSIGAALFVAAGLFATPSVASATTTGAGEFTTNGICAYEYQGRCVTWVTTEDTCRNILNITTDTRKHTACSIWKTQGIVTVWP